MWNHGRYQIKLFNFYISGSYIFMNKCQKPHCAQLYDIQYPILQCLLNQKSKNAFSSATWLMACHQGKKLRIWGDFHSPLLLRMRLWHNNIDITYAIFQQEVENRMRSVLNEIYFGKTRDIVNSLRSVEPLPDQRQQKMLQNDLAAALSKRAHINN